MMTGNACGPGCRHGRPDRLLHCHNAQTSSASVNDAAERGDSLPIRVPFASISVSLPVE
jgi:hypothetical protein